MSDSVTALATELRSALGQALGTLGGLDAAQKREEKLREALGVSSLSPEALLSRLAAVGAEQAGLFVADADRAPVRSCGSGPSAVEL